MDNTLTFIFGVASLLVTMWAIVGQGNGEDAGNKEYRRLTAWCLFVIATLTLPSMLLVWLTMQVTARILAPTTSDVSAFVTQIGWSVGAMSAIYPLVWGFKIHPRLDRLIAKIISSSEKKKDNGHKPAE